MPGTNPAERALEALHEKEFEKMHVMFRVSHSSEKRKAIFGLQMGPSPSGNYT